MRLILLAIMFSFSMSQIMGQNLQIVDVNDLNTDISGTAIEVVGDKDDQTISKEFRVINSGNEPVDVKYTRLRYVNSGRLDQVCDSAYCYNAADDYSYTSPQLNQITPDGGMTKFKPQIVPGGIEFCAVHKYYVVGNFNQKYDSITIIFKTTNAECNLSVDNKIQEESFSIFPNPAEEVVNIKGKGLTNGGTIVFLDALGKEVKQASFNGVNSKIDISTLKRGVYFVNIYNQVGVKSAVQRLVKK